MRALTDRLKASGYFWEDCCGKVGVAGSLLAVICCLGLPGLVSLITAIGLGVLVTRSISVGMLVTFITITLAGLWLGLMHHRRPLAFFLGLSNAILVIVFTLIWNEPIYAFTGIGGLMAASVLSMWYEHHRSFRRSISPEAAAKIAELHHGTVDLSPAEQSSAHMDDYGAERHRD